MKIAEYNEMMAYLTRPEPEVLPQPKPQELLDLQEQNRKQRLLQSLQKIGPRLEDSSLDFIRRENKSIGGGLIQGEDLGTREGFAKPSKRPGLFKDRASFIKALEKYWDSFKPNEKPSVTEISNHFSRSDIPRATLTNYLNDNTSYGKLTGPEKKQLSRNTANRIISKGQEDLKEYIRKNAKNFDNVDDFEKDILNNFNKPEYRGQDITGTYAPVSLKDRKRVGMKGGFVYDMPDGEPGLKLKGFKLEEYEKFQPEITESQGDSYKFIKNEGERGTFIRGQYKAFRQMLGLAMADKNSVVKEKLKKFIDFNKYKQKLTKERKFKIDYKKDIIDIDEVLPGFSKAELRSKFGVNKFLKDQGADFTSAGFSGNVGEIKDQFVRLYGPEKGLKEYRFYDETLRKYFRGMGFQKEHTVPRQLIKMDKVPLDQVTKVRGATGLVNAVAKKYQDKIIGLIKKADKANPDDLALISGKISDTAKDFKKLTGGYPLPFGVDEKGKFELLDPQPLSYKARGSKEVGPISRLALEFTDALRINENILNKFNQAVKNGMPQEQIFDTFGKESMSYLSKDYNINQGALKTDPKFKLKGVERELSKTYAKDPKKGYAALFQAFKQDPVGFLKNTRIGTAILRKESEGRMSDVKKPDFINKTATKLLKRGALPAILGGMFGPELLREVGLVDETFEETAGLGDVPIVEEKASFGERAATGAAAGTAAAPLATEKGRGVYGKAAKGLLKTLSAIDAPVIAAPLTGYFGTKLAKDISAGEKTDVTGADLLAAPAFTSMAASELGLLKPTSQGIGSYLLRAGLTPQAASRILPMISKGSTFALPAVETAIRMYNARKDLEEAREEYGMEDTVDTLLGEAPREYYEKIMSELPEVDREGAMYGGRIGYSNGSDGTDLAIKESLEAFKRYLEAGGKLGYKDFIALGNEGVSKFFNSGGRVGFADGPDDPKRRLYEIMAGYIASLPILGKFFKAQNAPVVQQLANTTTKMPDWFPNFVDRFINKGIGNKIDADLTEYSVKELPDVKLLKQDNGAIRVEGKNAYNEEYYIDYEPPGVEVVDYNTGKTVKTKGDFVATDTEYRMISPEDYDVDGVNVDEIDDILGGSSTDLEGFAKGTGKTKYTTGQRRIDEADARGASKDESLRADINDPYGDIDPTDFTDD